MAVVSSLGNNIVTTGGTTTVVATPALGDLIVIVTCYTGIATNILPTDNNADGHGTYSLVVAALKNASADRVAIYVRADAIQRAASTTFTIAPGASSGGGLQVFKITGMTISGPAVVRQSGSQANGAAAGTPTCALAGAALTGNPLIGAVFNATNPATMTAPTGFTENLDTGYATPTTGYESVLASSGVTASTITWGSTSASAFGAVVAEFSAAVGQQSTFPARGSGALDITQADSPRLFAVKRAASY